MKGREMIFLVNGFILLFVALFVAFYGALAKQTGSDCRTTNQTLCDRGLDLGPKVARTVPWFFAGGIGLLGIGATLYLYRRRFARGEPSPKVRP